MCRDGKGSGGEMGKMDSDGRKKGMEGKQLLSPTTHSSFITVVSALVDKPSSPSHPPAGR